MTGVDRVLIGPTADELERALAEAAASVNQGTGARRVKWAPARLRAALAEVAGRREGHLQWLAKQGHGLEGRSAVALAWWTDHLGRRHHRVVGRRGFLVANNSQSVLSPHKDQPALALVYPERIFQREQGRRKALWALCDCGAFGPPPALGWMGDRCGPCHDRREAGDPTSAGAVRVALEMPPGRVTDLTWSSDSQRLLACGSGKTEGHLWQVRTGEGEVLRFTKRVWGVAMASAADVLAVGLSSRVFVRGPGDARRELDTPGGWRVTTVALSADGTRLAAGGDSGLAVWGLPDGDVRLTDGGLVHALAIRPDGREVAAVGGEWRAHLWDVDTGQVRLRWPPEGNMGMGAVAFAPDGEALALATQAGKVWVQGLARPGPPRTFSALGAGGSRGLAFSPDGRLLAYAAFGGRVVFWGLEGQAELGALRWLGLNPTVLAFSPDGRWLAVGAGNRIALWPWRELLNLGHGAGRP
jgi:WD40 repeat protein